MHLRTSELLAGGSEVTVAAGMRQEINECEQALTIGVRQRQTTQLESFYQTNR